MTFDFLKTSVAGNYQPWAINKEIHKALEVSSQATVYSSYLHCNKLYKILGIEQEMLTGIS